MSIRPDCNVCRQFTCRLFEDRMPPLRVYLSQRPHDETPLMGPRMRQYHAIRLIDHLITIGDKIKIKYTRCVFNTTKIKIADAARFNFHLMQNLQ